MAYDFKFGDRWLSELGARCTEVPEVEIAQRDVTFIQIPGKDGDDCIDNGCYRNVEFKRKIGFIGNKNTSVRDKEDAIINEWAYLQGYQSFEDTDHPGLVTEAALKNFGAAKRKLRTFHSAELAFTRKPFWYLKTALEEISLDLSALRGGGVELFNPFPAEAKPLFRFDMTFPSASTQSTYDATLPLAITANFGGVYERRSYVMLGVTITRTHHFVVIDIENQQITVQNESGNIRSFVDKPIPAPIGKGKAVIELTQQYGIESGVYITPRWRCL